VGFTVFFCLSAGSVNEEMGWFKLREVESSFKEFLASRNDGFRVVVN
jgi:hypothetical protein